VAKQKEWAFLRGRLPELGPDPKYTEVIAALRARYEKRHITDVVRAWNVYTEQKAKLTRQLREVNADLVAIEHLVREHLDREQLESIECEGVKLSKSPEVNARIVDKGAFMDWLQANYPEMVGCHNSVPKKLVKEALRPAVPGQEPSPMPDGVDVTLWEAVKRKESPGYTPPADDDNEEEDEENVA
jgi:hypothetical protein